MSEFDVMKLAGHPDFRTTHRFYLRVRDDLVLNRRHTDFQSDIAFCKSLCRNDLCLSNTDF